MTSDCSCPPEGRSRLPESGFIARSQLFTRHRVLGLACSISPLLPPLQQAHAILQPPSTGSMHHISGCTYISWQTHSLCCLPFICQPVAPALAFLSCDGPPAPASGTQTHPPHPAADSGPTPPSPLTIWSNVLAKHAPTSRPAEAGHRRPCTDLMEALPMCAPLTCCRGSGIAGLK